MHLIFNYALNNQTLDENKNPIITGFPRNMAIDYIKVNKLKCDCDSDALITNNTELNNYDYKVKKTVIIDGTTNAITLPVDEKVTLRATDSVEITGEFEVPLGSEFEVITHQCPE